MVIFDWMKSTRSIAVVIVLVALSIGLLVGKVAAEQYILLTAVVISSYFNRRDTLKG